MTKQVFKIVPIREHALSFDPIVPAKTVLPEWYKNSPQQIEGTSTHLMPQRPMATTSTYKRCSPFLDGLTTGYMAILTADVEVTHDNMGIPYFMWRSPDRTFMNDHATEQWKGMQPPKGYAPLVMKWIVDVGLDTPAGYSTLFTHPMNRYDLPFLTMSGVVDTDNYHEPVLFPFWIRNDFQGIIEKGTPVCQIFPFKREEWKSEGTPFDAASLYKQQEAFHSRIIRSYKTHFWSKKSYE